MRNLLILTPKKLVYIILFWTIISDSLVAELGFPSSIQYLNDVVCVILLYYVFTRRFTRRFASYGVYGLAVILMLYIFVCYFSSVINFVDPFLVLWASRNSFRFIVFFIACVMYLDLNDVTMIFKVLFWVQIVSFILALYQYYVLGYHMDLLGGIFGHGNGAALNTFQAMIYVYYLCACLEKKEAVWKLAIILLTSLIIAALAEEKAFFVYLIVGTAGCILINRPSIKAVLCIAALAVLVPFGINLLGTVNEAWNLSVLTNMDSAVTYMDSSYGLSRLNPFPQINSLFFNNSIVKNLFGIGFGASENCDASSLLTSDFFRKYYHLQYFDFTHQKKFIETGYVGCFSFVLIFVYLFIAALKNRKSFFEAKAMAVFCWIAVLSCFFSGALICNDAYIIYYGISIVAIIEKQKCLEETAI